MLEFCIIYLASPILGIEMSILYLVCRTVMRKGEVIIVIVLEAEGQVSLHKRDQLQSYMK